MRSYLIVLVLSLAGCAAGPRPFQAYTGNPKPLSDVAVIQADWLRSLRLGKLVMGISKVDENDLGSQISTGHPPIQIGVLPGRHTLEVSLAHSEIVGGFSTGSTHVTQIKTTTQHYYLVVDARPGFLYAICYDSSDDDNSDGSDGSDGQMVPVRLMEKGMTSKFTSNWNDVVLKPCGQ